MARVQIRFASLYFAAGDVPKVVDTTRRALQLLEEQHREKDLFAGGLNLYSELCGYAGWLWGGWGSLRKEGMC